MRRIIVLLSLLFLTESALAETYPPLLDRRLVAILAPADGALACYSLATPGARFDVRETKTGELSFNRRIESMVYQLRIRKWTDAPAGYGYQFLLLSKIELIETRLLSGGECGMAHGDMPPDPADGPWIVCRAECDGGHVLMRKRDDGGLDIRWEKDRPLRVAGCRGGEESQITAYGKKSSDLALTFTPAPLDDCQEADRKASGE